MSLISKNRLSKMMLDTLLEMPPGSSKLKEQVVARLEFIGRMSATRDIRGLSRIRVESCKSVG